MAIFGGIFTIKENKHFIVLRQESGYWLSG